MDADSTDSFYQQLDSLDVLKRHRLDLVRQAQEVLRAKPDMRVAGLIAAKDSNEAQPLLRNWPAGQPPPPGPLTAIIARRDVEQLLTNYVGTKRWLEATGQPQCTLPVVAATRDGYRFAFFDLDATATDSGDATSDSL